MPQGQRFQANRMNSSSASNTLLLSLNDYWNQYHRLLKACRQSSKRGVVHDLRTTLRRLIAILDIVEELIDLDAVCILRKSFKHQLDSLRDLRDLQVQEKSLKKVGKQTVLGDFHKYLQKRQKIEEKAVTQLLKKVAPKKLGARLLRISEELVSCSRADKDELVMLHRLAKILTNNFSSLKSFIHKVVPSEPSTFHKTRIQFKKFRYTSEVLDSVFPSSVKSREKMKVLQTLLGDIQDTTVMIESLASFLTSNGRSSTAVQFLDFLRTQEEKQKNKIELFQENKGKLLSIVQPHIELRHSNHREAA